MSNYLKKLDLKTEKTKSLSELAIMLYRINKELNNYKSKKWSKNVPT